MLILHTDDQCSPAQAVANAREILEGEAARYANGDNLLSRVMRHVYEDQLDALREIESHLPAS